ncbi:MAG: hypothetical protein RLP02_35060 [Coleofasciculus sp. C2-GNP5-27]
MNSLNDMPTSYRLYRNPGRIGIKGLLGLPGVGAKRHLKPRVRQCRTPTEELIG